MITPDYLKQQTENLKLSPYLFFDTSITDKLPLDDRRINFIYDNLKKIGLPIIEDGAESLGSKYNNIITPKPSTWRVFEDVHYII